MGCIVSLARVHVPDVYADEMCQRRAAPLALACDLINLVDLFGVLASFQMLSFRGGRAHAPTGFHQRPQPQYSRRKSYHRQASSSQEDASQDSSPATPASVEPDTKDRMDKSLDALKRSLSTISTGRANPNMLDRITVDYYGAPTPLNQMASVTTPESSLLVIQPFDISAIPDIERAILGSDVDITPSNDGKVIRLNVPQLTADRRKEMTKVASKMGEEGKVAIRNVRRDMLKKVEKLADEVGEDGKKDLVCIGWLTRRGASLETFFGSPLVYFSLECSQFRSALVRSPGGEGAEADRLVHRPGRRAGEGQEQRADEGLDGEGLGYCCRV